MGHASGSGSRQSAANILRDKIAALSNEAYELEELLSFIEQNGIADSKGSYEADSALWRLICQSNR